MSVSVGPVSVCVLCVFAFGHTEAVLLPGPCIERTGSCLERTGRGLEWTGSGLERLVVGPEEGLVLGVVKISSVRVSLLTVVWN